MKKACVWLLGVLAVVLLATPTVMAQDDWGGEAPKKKAQRKKGPRRKPQRKERPDVYAQMAELLKLEADAKDKFDAQVAENKKAVTEWTAANGEKLGQLRKDLAAARTEKDKDKMKTLGGEMRKLTAEKQKIEKEGMDKVLALLTDEQKAAWAAFKLRQQVTGRLRRCKLTEDQVAQVQTMCEASAKEITAAKSGKDKAAAMKKLEADIKEKVLTEEQREKLTKRGGGKEPRVRKPKAEKVKKNKQPAAEGGELGNPEW